MQKLYKRVYSVNAACMIIFIVERFLRFLHNVDACME
jgi:hypothetical protein